MSGISFVEVAEKFPVDGWVGSQGFADGFEYRCQFFGIDAAMKGLRDQHGTTD